MFETNKFSFIGNSLFLDFVNTQKMRDGQLFETLEAFEDFIAWAIQVKLLNEKQGLELLRTWSQKPAVIEFMNAAIDFRNLLRGMAVNISDGKELKPVMLKTINARLKTHGGFTEINANETGFEKSFQIDLSDLLNLLHPIAESAADFLCYGNFEYLRKCGNSKCVLYFYDITKNHKRRWCSMSGCGNAAKAAAFYQRKKKNIPPMMTNK